MTDLTSTGGVEGWISRADRTIRGLEQKVMKARVPRTCTSKLRPNPAKIQPGVRVFETDTNRSIFVNASQTGWVDADGGALAATSGQPNGGSTGTTTPDDSVSTPILINTDAPRINGTLTVGSTLTVYNGLWSATPDVCTYQWVRGGSPIPGATGSTYTTVAADGGQQLVVVVTAHRAGYGDNSAQTAPATIAGAVSGPTVTASATAGANQAVLTWSVQNGPISGLTGWLVSRDGTDTNGTGPWSTTVAADVYTFTFTALAGGTTYNFTVRPVVNDVAGTGASASATPTGSTASTSTPVTGAGKFAAIQMPSRGWFSGVAADGKDGFGSWRGDAVDCMSTWIDGANGSVWTGGIGGNTGPGAGFVGLLDIAIGGPSDYGAAANGSLDGALTSMLQRVRANRVLNGKLQPTVIRPFHEMNGTWYAWSVNAGNLSNFRATARRWRNIANQVFPEAVWACSFNGETTNNVTAAAIYENGVWDMVGTDRYNQYPYIGTARGGGYTSWADGSIRGSADNPVGVQRWLAFAAARGVPLYLPEYGNNGSNDSTAGGDDPYWIQQFIAWVKANKGPGSGQVFAEMYFNVVKEGNKWHLYNSSVATLQPRVAAAYNALFPIT